MDKFSELKAAAMAATPGPWSINRTGNTIVSNQSHPLATVSDAFHRQLAGGGVGKDAEFIAAANPAAVLELLAELEAKDERIGELEAIATEYAGKFQKAQDAAKHLIIMNDEDKKRISELESEGKVWESAATKHLARAEEAEQRVAELSELETHNQCLIKKNADLTQQNIKLGERLATPVRLTDERTLWADEDDYDTGHVKGWNANRIEQAALLKKQGFTVEGDEQ